MSTIVDTMSMRVTSLWRVAAGQCGSGGHVGEIDKARGLFRGPEPLARACTEPRPPPARPPLPRRRHDRRGTHLPPFRGR
jgi:hypothetical protein